MHKDLSIKTFSGWSNWNLFSSLAFNFTNNASAKENSWGVNSSLFFKFVLVLYAFLGIFLRNSFLSVDFSLFLKVENDGKILKRVSEVVQRFLKKSTILFVKTAQLTSQKSPQKSLINLNKTTKRRTFSTPWTIQKKLASTAIETFPNPQFSKFSAGIVAVVAWNWRALEKRRNFSFVKLQSSPF